MAFGQDSTTAAPGTHDATDITALTSVDGSGGESGRHAARPRKRSPSLELETPTVKRVRPGQMIAAGGGGPAAALLAPAPACSPIGHAGLGEATAAMVARTAPPRLTENGAAAGSDGAAAAQTGGPRSIEPGSATDVDGASEGLLASDARTAVGTELADPSKWLSGATVSWFTAMIAACSPSSGSLDLPLAADETTLTGARASLARKLADAEALGLAQLISAVNHKKHWMLVVVTRGVPPKLSLYDSLPSEPSTARIVLSKVRDLLPRQTGSSHRIPPCPKQDDTTNCGVYTIVFALFAATGTPLPPSLAITLWRHLLTAMAAKKSLSTLLPRDLIHPVPATDPLDPALGTPAFPPLPPAASRAEVIDARLTQIAALAGAAHASASRDLAWYARRSRDVSVAVEWLGTEVRPVMGRLVRCVGEEVLGWVGETLAAILRGRAVLEELVGRLDGGGETVVGCQGTLAAAREGVRQSVRLERAVGQRREMAEEMRGAVEGLDIDEVEKMLRASIGEYDRHVLWAEGVCGRLAKPLVGSDGDGH